MYLLRTIFAFLIALSLATAPSVAALAMSTDHPDTAGSMAGMGDGMDDCSKTGHAEGNSKCPCCDSKNACPPEFCLTKCFKVFRNVVQPDTLRVMVAFALRPSEPSRPPDWSCAPQPPPPRT